MRSLLVFATCLLAFSYAKTYKVSIEGEVVCAGKPVKDADVELWERDRRKLKLFYTPF